MVDKTTFTVNETNLTMRIQQAEMYLKEFENEVATSVPRKMPYHGS